MSDCCSRVARFFRKGRELALSAFMMASSDKISIFFRNQPNQASFSPKHEYAHTQTAATNSQVTITALSQKTGFKLSALLRMFILSSVLGWICLSYPESDTLC